MYLLRELNVTYKIYCPL